MCDLGQNEKLQNMTEKTGKVFVQAQIWIKKTTVE